MFDYVYAVSIVAEENGDVFLKTIIPSRKAKKRYLKKVSAMKSKKKTDPNPFKLDAYEKDILDAYEKGLLKPSKNAEEMKRYAKEAAANYLRKDKKINVRISMRDLLQIKALAEKEGLPYQTFITSILHKISTGQAVHFAQDDKKAA